MRRSTTASKIKSKKILSKIIKIHNLDVIINVLKTKTKLNNEKIFGCARNKNFVKGMYYINVLGKLSILRKVKFTI